MSRPEEIPQRKKDHQDQARVKQSARPVAHQEMLSHPKNSEEHQKWTETGEHGALPSPVSEPAQQIGKQGQGCKAWDQPVHEEAFPLAQEAQADGRTETRRGRKTGSTTETAHNSTNDSRFFSDTRYHGHDHTPADGRYPSDITVPGYVLKYRRRTSPLSGAEPEPHRAKSWKGHRGLSSSYLLCAEYPPICTGYLRE
jgi:hypothetical protein